MDENQTTTEGYEYDIPGVETEAATETPTETSVGTPSYVTKDDLSAFAQQIVEGIRTSQFSNAPMPSTPTVDTEEFYTEVADQFYDNPAEAFKRIADHTRKAMLDELAPALQTLSTDYSTRTVTSGLQPLEAEYVQNLASKGLINPKTMQDPVLSDVILRAAKSYAAEKAPTRTPSAEGTVGGAASFGGIDPNAKAAFEAAFGMKYHEGLKKAGLA